MYEGHMLDNLIASVERAEAHALPVSLRISEPQPQAEMFTAYTEPKTFNENILGVA